MPELPAADARSRRGARVASGAPFRAEVSNARGTGHRAQEREAQSSSERVRQPRWGRGRTSANLFGSHHRPG